MNRRSLGALITLNIVLLAALVLVSLTPQTATAQLRRPGEYLMIPGESRGRPQENMIYLLEIGTARMVAITFNSSNNRLQTWGVRVIGDDLAAGPGGRR